MNNEEKILQLLTNVDKRIDSMQTEMKGMNNRIDSMQTEMKIMNNRIDSVQTEMTERFSVIQTEMAEMKGQLTENTSIIKSVLHNQEYANAKLEGLELTTAKAESTATKDDLKHIENKLKILNNDMFDQRAALVDLKLVK